jgi:hypothetical protein
MINHGRFTVYAFDISEGKIILTGCFTETPYRQKVLEVDQVSVNWAIQRGVSYRLTWDDSQLRKAFCTQLAVG